MDHSESAEIMAAID
ncbi:hypothetical protein R1C91_26400 [Escherichia coli]